jgi:hypothetical protein
LLVQMKSLIPFHRNIFFTIRGKITLKKPSKTAFLKRTRLNLNKKTTRKQSIMTNPILIAHAAFQFLSISHRFAQIDPINQSECRAI